MPFWLGARGVPNGNTEPVRVAVVHTDFRLYWPARLQCLNRVLAHAGHQLRVCEIAGRGSPYSFAAQNDEDESLGGWDILFPECEMEGIGAGEANAAVLRWLDEWNPEVVLCGAIAFPSGAACVRWARRHRRPVVVFDDARRGDVPRPWLVNAIKRCIYRNVDAMLLPAPSHADDYASWGVRRERMFFGVNVVDNEFWSAAAGRARAQADALRSASGLPSRYILAVGRQVPKKNLRCLIDAYARFRQKAEGAVPDLVLVGEGPERQALEEQVAGQAVIGVRLLPFADPAKLALYYALADALVLPSLAGETWGLVVNEAMACGVPVLVSRSCGCAKTLVEEGRNGWTFDPTDVSGLSGLLARMNAMSAEQCLAMGNASRMIIANWGLVRFAQGVLAAIDAVKGEHRGFRSPIDRVILSLWKGRYRPT